jgi:hypothetical protein
VRQQPFAFSENPIRDLFGMDAAPVHWPSLTPVESAEQLAVLAAWARGLVRRFSIEPRIVPPCWDRHPGMVEALSALRDHERGAFADDAPPGAAVDFLRAVRDVEHFLADQAAKTQCSAGMHRPPMLPEWAASDESEQGTDLSEFSG